MPLVSVIVSCYNQGSYLRESLGSILEQTYKEWECIIIDDGSTDQTKQIAEYFMSIDNRIKYIYQKNQGVCVARNNAIRSSIGKYILCLDADDKISNDYLSLSVDEMERDLDVTLVTTNYCNFGCSNKKIELEPYTIERLMGHNLFVICSMFRRVDFDRVNGFNLNMKLGLEDWDFWLSLLEKREAKVKYLNGIHFYYRIKKSEFSRNSQASKKEMFDALRKQIWLNHQSLYAQIYSPVYYSDEYIKIIHSKEYRLGVLLLSLVRKLYALLRRMA